MLSSAKIGTASWRHYTAGAARAATEYYLGEAPGRWHGRGLDEQGSRWRRWGRPRSWSRCSPGGCIRERRAAAGAGEQVPSMRSAFGDSRPKLPIPEPYALVGRR